MVREHGEGKRDEITSGIMQQVEYRKRELTREPDYHPLFKPPASGYKPPPTMEEVNKPYELGVSLDSFKT